MRTFTVSESGTQQGIRVSPPAGQMLRDAYVRVGFANGAPQGVAVDLDVAKPGECFDRASVIRSWIERELRIIPERDACCPNVLVLVRISRGPFRRVVWTLGSRQSPHFDRKPTLLMRGYEFNRRSSHCQYRLIIMEPGALLCVFQTGEPSGIMREIRIEWDGEQIGFERIDAKPLELIDLPLIS